MRILLSSATMVACLVACDGGAARTSAQTPVTVAEVPTPTPTPAPGPAPAPGQSGSALSQVDARIGACVNMANHLEPPNEGDWGRAINATDFRDIRAAGFETIRLPVRWSNHASYSPPYTIDPAFMTRVADVVAQARAAGLRVILNMHHYEDAGGNIFADPAGQTTRFTGLWKQIADRFRNESDMVWFELLNEPHDKLTDANLLLVLTPALAEVRATNPTRPVVIGGQNWSGVNSLATLPLPDDRYLIATFHYYDPFNFTHQGATWVTPTPPIGATFGDQADRDQLARDVTKVTDFMTRTGRPVFMGETGAHSTIPVDQRAGYHKAVHDAFGAANVDQCVWGYVNTFPFRNAQTGAWETALLRAIGLP